jgi:hypothetical protein
MKKQRKLETAIDPTWKVTILSVSPYDEDQSSLEAIIGHSRWMLFKARDLVSTLAVLKRQAISVLLCDRDLLPGKWTDVMEHVTAMRNAPSLIVTSRLADDRHKAIAALNDTGFGGSTIRVYEALTKRMGSSGADWR